MRLEIYRGKGKQPWRWRMVARNNRIVACSGEGFVTVRTLAKSLWRMLLDLNPERILQLGRHVVWSDEGPDTLGHFVAAIRAHLKDMEPKPVRNAKPKGRK